MARYIELTDDCVLKLHEKEKKRLEISWKVASIALQLPVEFK